MVKNWNDYEKTGNPAVDLVAHWIWYYRKKHQPVKTIFLSKGAYNLFSVWVKSKLKEEFDPKKTYQFDGVNIDKGSDLMIKDCYVEFYGEQVRV